MHVYIYNSKYDMTYHIPAVGTVHLVDLTHNNSAKFDISQTTPSCHPTTKGAIGLSQLQLKPIVRLVIKLKSAFKSVKD